MHASLTKLNGGLGLAAWGSSNVGARGAAVIRARCRARQREGRIGQVDHGDARRRRAHEHGPAGRDHRPRLPPEELHPLHRPSPHLGGARRPAAEGAGAFLHRPRRHAAARRERGDRIRRAGRGGGLGRALARLHRGRYARHRRLSDAAGAFDGRHADHAAQRQIRRFRRARHRRSHDLRGDRRKPLRRDGARRAPPAPRRRRRPHRTGSWCATGSR